MGVFKNKFGSGWPIFLGLHKSGFLNSNQIKSNHMFLKKIQIKSNQVKTSLKFPKSSQVKSLDFEKKVKSSQVKSESVNKRSSQVKSSWDAKNYLQVRPNHSEPFQADYFISSSQTSFQSGVSSSNQNQIRGSPSNFQIKSSQVRE